MEFAVSVDLMNLYSSDIASKSMTSLFESERSWCLLGLSSSRRQATFFFFIITSEKVETASWESSLVCSS
jgi:hypothetical protein